MGNLGTPDLVSKELRTDFGTKGYVKIPGLIDRKKVQAVKRRVEEMHEGRHDYTWPNKHLRSFDPENKDTPGGNFRTGTLQLPASLEQVFHDFAYDERLIEAMEALLGGPVKHYTDQTIFKPGEIQAGRSFYHQDGYYWHLKPGRCINAWIALDTVDRDAIALAFLPGTHATWRIAHHEEYWDEVTPHGGDKGVPFKRKRIPLAVIDDSKEELVPGEPGDAFFFTNYTWHRAEPNLSGVNKGAYAIAYQLDREDNRLTEAELSAITDPPATRS